MIENWGYTIEHVIAEETYGLKHSNTQSINPISLDYNRYRNLIEQEFIIFNHIQIGWLYDLNDLNSGVNSFENWQVGTSDQISNIKFTTMINAMTNEVDNPSKLKVKLKNTLTTQNEKSAVDNLSSIYNIQ